MTPFPLYEGTSRNKFRGPYTCRQDIYLSDEAYKCHLHEEDEHNMGKKDLVRSHAERLIVQQMPSTLDILNLMHRSTTSRVVS